MKNAPRQKNHSRTLRPEAHLSFPSSLNIFFAFFIFLGILINFFLKEQQLVSAYFENNDSLFFASMSFIPVLGILLIGFEGQRFFRPAIVAVIASFGVVISYLSTYEMRVTFSKLYGISPMPIGLGDWMFIPSFINCEDASGCDPLNRIAAYGSSWKFLFPLANEFLSVLILAAAVFYIMYEVGRFAFYLKLPFLQVMLFLSPSFLFSLERGNSDLFLFALILLGIRFISKFPYIDIVYGIFLSTFKPFFIGYIFKRMPRKRVLFLSIPIFIFFYLWSMKLDATLIRSVRSALLYPPVYQIGVDQIPSYFLQQYLSIKNNANAAWNGSLELFYPSLVLGGLSLLFVTLLLLRYFPTKSVVEEINSLPERFAQLTWVTMAVFLIVFLSGSQVSYKSWMAYPIIFVYIKMVITSSVLKDRLPTSIGALLVFGGLGINIWTLRNLGAFVLAALCLACFVQAYFPDLSNRARTLIRKIK
jgi:hypothetical protein